LLQHTNDQTLINEAIQIMVDAGSLDYARDVAKKIVTEAWKDVESILPESEAKHKLKLFADYLVNRDW
jgi:geranylgeranyl pyrophosphate synthase